MYKVGNPQEHHASNQVALHYRTHGNPTKSSGWNPCSLRTSQNNDLQEWDVSVSHSSGYDLMVFEAHSALRGTVNNNIYMLYISRHMGRLSLLYASDCYRMLYTTTEVVYKLTCSFISSLVAIHCLQPRKACEPSLNPQRA